MSEPTPADHGGPPADPGSPAAEQTAPEVPVRGLRAALGDDFSFVDAIGGVRGLVESTTPGLVFVVVYVATRQLTPALITASVAALVAVVVRLVQRTPVTQALSGVIGVGIGVVWAALTGKAEDYYLWGVLVNVAYGAAFGISVLVRWPLVGVLVALMRNEGMDWRTDPAKDHERRRFVWATWLWTAMFALRLAVQLPLYLSGQVGALGTAKLAMGAPLFAVVLWLTWLLVASPGARAERRDQPRHQPR